jgi:hypothetical protein
MTMIRVASVLLASCALITIASHSASAEIYRPWCAQYTSRGGSTNCGFTSYQQCMATVRGIGGYCVQNPWYLQYGQGGRGTGGYQWR